MVAVKIIALPLVGVAGVLGASSPLIHIGVTKSDYKTKWYERTNFSQPIFKNCHLTDPNTNPLNVYLTLQGVNTSAGNKKVSLKVVEKTSGGEEKVVWGEGSNDSDKDVWDKLKLQYSGGDDKKVKFMYPYKNEHGHDVRTGIANCDDVLVEFVVDKGGFRGTGYVDFKNIKFTLSSVSHCTEGFSLVECDINIGPENQVKWIEGFRPKIIYTPF